MDNETALCEKIAALVIELDSIAYTLKSGFRGIGSSKHAAKVDDARDSFRSAAKSLGGTGIASSGKTSFGFDKEVSGSLMTTIRADLSKMKSTAKKIGGLTDNEETFKSQSDTQITNMTSAWHGTDYIAYLAQWTRMMGKGSTAAVIVEGLRAYKEMLEFAMKKYGVAQQAARGQNAFPSFPGMNLLSNNQNIITVDPQKLRDISEQLRSVVKKTWEIISSARELHNQLNQSATTFTPPSLTPTPTPAFTPGPLPLTPPPPAVDQKAKDTLLSLANLQRKLEDALMDINQVTKTCDTTAQAFEDAERDIRKKVHEFGALRQQMPQPFSIYDLDEETTSLLAMYGAEGVLLYERYNFYREDGRWKELLTKPADEIEDLEYHVLALIFIDLQIAVSWPCDDDDQLIMEHRYANDDLETFIWLLGDQKPQGGSYIRWEMNQQKIGMIKGYLDAYIDAVDEQYQNYVLMPYEDMKAAYVEQYGSLPNDISDEDLRDYYEDLEAEIRNTKLALKQKSALLTTVGEFSNYYQSPFIYEITGLRKVTGGQGLLWYTSQDPQFSMYPPIALVQNGDDIKVVYVDDPLEGGPFTGLMAKSITIKMTNQGSTSIGDMHESVDEYFFEEQDLKEKAIDSGTAFARKQAHYQTKKNLELMRDKILRKENIGVAGKVGARALPFVSTVYTAYDLAESNYDNQVADMEHKSISQNLGKTDVCEQFNLDYTKIKPANSAMDKIILSQGTYTPVRIHNFNEWVKYKTLQVGGVEYLDPRIKDVGANGIITIEDILADPEALSALWAPGGPMDNLEDKDYHNKIFSGTDLLYLTPSGQLVQERKLTPNERAQILCN